jgi:hypothetical protein
MGGSDDSSNLVLLGYREHYIIHYILAKVYETDKLWFAFNMMKRVCEGRSVLYEYARKHIRNAVSNSNSGRKHSEKAKRKMSDQRKSMVVVRDKSGNTFRTSVDDPKYISGEYVFYRTGTKHSKTTIEKMKSSSIRDKIVCHNSITGKWKYVERTEDIPDGYVLGSGPLFKETANNRKKVSHWYTNMETMECRRFAVNDDIPDGYIKGRKNLNKDENGRFIKTK